MSSCFSERYVLRGALGILLVSAFASACAEEEQPKPADNPIAGLYTPGSVLGASDPTDVPRPGMGLGERCVALSFGEGAAQEDAGIEGVAIGGELEVTYQTQTKMGRYAPKNCVAVWVETMDGRFVATLEVGAGLRKPGLVYWQEHACTEQSGPDVIATATLRDHVKPHIPVWSGLDFQGKPVPDGPYKLFIEVTETDKEPGEVTEFDFVKGKAFEMDAPVDVEGPLASVKIAWTYGE